jgi:uncharacterized protein (DUF2235 family)
MRNFVYFMCLVLISQSFACRIKDQSVAKNKQAIKPKVISVYMDGTANTAHVKQKKLIKNTNIHKLFNLDTGSTSKYYIEGVGANKKIIGLFAAWGIKRRSVRAYLFIANSYQMGDTINLFGFSRGAYNAKIVSNMIYVFGIADFENIDSAKQVRIVRKLYRKHKSKNESVLEKRKHVNSFVTRWNKRHDNKKHENKKQQIVIDTQNKTKINVLGFWDTVEAFGWPDKEENFIAPNKWHLNQLSNVNKAYHAVSLDDNRARIYTPILLTSKEIQATVDSGKTNVVEEVWFSGSHSDVGGGHKDLPDIRNNSLIWMMNRPEIKQLYAKDSTLIEYPYANIHNMQTLIFRAGTKRRIRSINKYYAAAGNYNYGCLLLHESVVLRMKEGLIPHFKTARHPYYMWYDAKGFRFVSKIWRKPFKDWYDEGVFADCFTKKGSKRILKDGCNCIEVVSSE